MARLLCCTLFIPVQVKLCLSFWDISKSVDFRNTIHGKTKTSCQECPKEYSLKALLLLGEIILHDHQLKGETLPAEFVTLITKTKKYSSTGP